MLLTSAILDANFPDMAVRIISTWERRLPQFLDRDFNPHISQSSTALRNSGTGAALVIGRGLPRSGCDDTSTSEAQFRAERHQNNTLAIVHVCKMGGCRPLASESIPLKTPFFGVNSQNNRIVSSLFTISYKTMFFKNR